MCVQVMGKYAKSGRETTFTATGLSKEGVNRYMFTFKDKKAGTEKEMSVAQYFAKILGINLQFPALQCVTVLRPLLQRLHTAALHHHADFMYACMHVHVCMHVCTCMRALPIEPTCVQPSCAAARVQSPRMCVLVCMHVMMHACAPCTTEVAPHPPTPGALRCLPSAPGVSRPVTLPRSPPKPTGARGSQVPLQLLQVSPATLASHRRLPLRSPRGCAALSPDLPQNPVAPSSPAAPALHCHNLSPSCLQGPPHKLTHGSCALCR